MYQVFDAFLDRETWETMHENEDRQFNLALAKVVGNPKFDAAAMGAYMRASADTMDNYRRGKKIGASSDGSYEDPRGQAIRRYVAAAGAVADFFKHNGTVFKAGPTP